VNTPPTSATPIRAQSPPSPRNAAGNTYVTGNRGNPSIPIPTNIIPNPFVGGFSSVFLTIFSAPYAPDDVFVSKIDSSGKVLFTNTFAGKGVDQAFAVAVDPTGNIYVAGTTSSPDFPVSNALQSQPSQFGTGFIVKLSPDGRTILYSTYFGGTRRLHKHQRHDDGCRRKSLSHRHHLLERLSPTQQACRPLLVVQAGIPYTSQSTSAAFVAALTPRATRLSSQAP